MKGYRVIFAVLMMMCLGPVTARAAAKSSPSASDATAAVTSAAAPEQDNDLRQQLLNELMSDKPINPPKRSAIAKEAAVERGSASEDSSSDAASTTRAETVGSAVASVPTWPILGLMLVMGGALMWFKRGTTGRNGSIAINKLASVPLGGKRSLAVVDVLGQKLVLGLSEKGLTLLARIDGSTLTPMSESPTPETDPLEDDLANLIQRREEEFFNSSSTTIAGPGEQRELARKFKNIRSA